MTTMLGLLGGLLLVIGSECADDVCRLEDEDEVMLLQSRAFMSRELHHPLPPEPPGGHPSLAGAPKVLGGKLEPIVQDHALDVLAADVVLHVEPEKLNFTTDVNTTWLVPQSGVELRRAAALLAEALCVLCAELLRRAWVQGVVEATTDARVIVLGFPIAFWFLHRFSCVSKKEKEELPKVAFPVVTASEDTPEPETAEESFFDQVGCALVQPDRDSVSFRNRVVINAPGLAYTAFGRAASSGRWRVQLDAAACRAGAIVGCMAEADVAAAGDELGSHWAFVGAEMGRGYGYCPEGLAVRRGGETPCDPLPESIPVDLELDAAKRTLDVYCASEEPVLLCSFAGIKNVPYRLAVSLRGGSVRVSEL